MSPKKNSLFDRYDSFLSALAKRTARAMSVILFTLLISASAVPLNRIQRAADNDFQVDNYLAKPGDLPKFHYSTFGGTDSNENLLDVVEFKSIEDKGNDNGRNFLKQESTDQPVAEEAETTTVSSTETLETTTVDQETTTTVLDETTTIQEQQGEKDLLDPVFLDENGNNTMNRTARQEDSDESNDVEFTNGGSNEKENQESEEDEEEPDMITGLISAFLGGLSRPDGSVDVEAITGLLGGLSTQNPDGTYDFSGLSDILMSFFGGTGEEGGGSNFGAFLGGLAGAFVKGIANPPGAKGSGIFLGNFLTAVLPGLSAPAPTEEGATEKPQPPLDSGSFIGGLLKSVLPSLGNFSSGSSAAGGGGGDGGSKFSLFKAIFSMITKIFSSSSSAH